MPLGAMLVSAAHADRLADLTGFNFSYSYNANPIACAAGSAVLDEFERLDLCRNAEVRGAELRAGLEELMARSPVLGDVRGVGLLLAVEIIASKRTKAALPPDFMAPNRLRIHGLAEGIMLYARATAGGKFGQWFMVAPPLTISAEEGTEILKRTERAVDRLARDATQAGLL